MHCCRTLTLASARLYCYNSWRTGTCDLWRNETYELQSIWHYCEVIRNV